MLFKILKQKKMKNMYRIVVDDREIEFEKPKVTGREILEKAGKTPVDSFTLYQKFKDDDFKKIGLEDLVDLEREGLEKFVTKEPEVFNYTINGEPEMTDKKELTPDEILRLAGINHETHYLVQLLLDHDKEIYAYCPHEPIRMECTGMKFISAEWLAKVNIEEYGKVCKEVPPARLYEIKIDKKDHLWKERFISAHEIIKLSERKPEHEFSALKFTSTQPKPQKLKADEKVDLWEKCLLRFVVQPKTQDDGSEMRRQFKLPAHDEEFLESLGFPWETISDGNFWLLIHGYPIPSGYNVDKADVALMIPAQYDAAQIDMAYFLPNLNKTSGKGINRVTPRQIDGKIFQQWSRHRKTNEWVPGVDNIATHLSLVDNWLTNDLTR
jgi:hypothetical protein